MNKRTFKVQVMPLNVSSAMEILGDGSFRQKFSRDDNAYYPSYSSVLPLKIGMKVNIQDPDGVIPTGPIAITRIDWYKGAYAPANKIASNDPDYEITSESGRFILKVKRNTPVDSPFDLYGEAFYVNPKTNKVESRVESRTLSSIYYEATNLSLRVDSPSDVIVDPTLVDDSVETNWNVQAKALLFAGSAALADKNAVYFWDVLDNGSYRRVGASDTWAVSKPNADGTYSRIMTINTSKIKDLSLICRAAYKGDGDATPTHPSDDSLQVPFTIKVSLPPIWEYKHVPEVGMYIKPTDVGTAAPIVSRCDIYAGGRLIENPEKYYNITWKATPATLGAASVIVGYGARITTTVQALGITYANPVNLEPVVKQKIGSWNVEGSVYNGTGVNPVYQFGVNNIADQLGAYLVRINAGVVEIAGKLKNNNFTRFDNGSLAPTMLNSAGEDAGYNIMYGWIKPIYTIENAEVGDEVVSLFSEYPFEYNGVSSRKIPPTLINAGLPTLVGGKFRTIYHKFNAGVSGSNGELGIVAFNRADRTYPRTTVNQLTTDDYAMAHNPDITKTVPFAPLMDWNLLNITNALFNKFKTVYLHDENKFGAGISSNNAVSATNWGNVTGVRYKVAPDSTWTYNKLGDTPTFRIDATGTAKTWNTLISKEYPRMRCMEIQMALSYAAENGIVPDQTFTFDGEDYYYRNVPGATTLLNGEMNARLYKVKQLSFSAFNTSGAAVNVTAEVCLQTSAVYGIDILSADVFQYAGAGFERIVTLAEATQGTALTNIIKSYLCIDQERLVIDKNFKKTVGQTFDCENSAYYTLVGETPQRDGYMSRLIRGTRIGSIFSGSLNSNSAYVYQANYTSGVVNDRFRLGVRTRGAGLFSTVSARFSYSSYPASYANTYYAGGFQVRLPEGDA